MCAVDNGVTLGVGGVTGEAFGWALATDCVADAWPVDLLGMGSPTAIAQVRYSRG